MAQFIAHAKDTSFRLAADYDYMRLATYRKLAGNRSCISIRRNHEVTLLRFDNVGYFNSVYAADESVVDKIGEIECFFRGSPFGCRLILPELDIDGPVATMLTARGWIPDLEYAWLSAEPIPNPDRPTGQLTLRQPSKTESELFFRIYLESFDANPDQRDIAVTNMQLLFDNPQLRFVFACSDEEPVGIGMWSRSGEDALLCAGAVLPRHRKSGGHRQLLVERVRQAKSEGCQRIHSWTTRGSRSHSNMEQVGLQTVQTTHTFRLPPEQLT